MKVNVCRTWHYHQIQPLKTRGPERGKPTKSCAQCEDPLFVFWRGHHMSYKEVIDKILSTPEWRGASVCRLTDRVLVEKGAAKMRLKLHEGTELPELPQRFCLKTQRHTSILCYWPHGHAGGVCG